MKRTVGSILCVLAILQIISLAVSPKEETTAHLIQRWALVGVMLAMGIPLSAASKKPESSDKK
jgi:hypothetical protein